MARPPLPLLPPPGQEGLEGGVRFGGFERGREGVRFLGHAMRPFRGLGVAAQQAAGREQAALGLAARAAALLIACARSSL